MKVVTMPRLELIAAVVLVKVAAMAFKELDIPDLKSYFYTDSKIVLGYIASECRRFRLFVANRVETIHRYTRTEQ